MLLLDEPSASLDPRQRERLWEFIGALGTTVVFSTHDVGEAERFADRVLVLADGELLFTGTPDELVGDRASRLRGARSSASSTSGVTRRVRWLLLKDLQILRRSPLLVALLVIYPIVIAVLFGFALSGGPEKPRVAFANLVPPGESEFSVGGRDARRRRLRRPAVRVDRPDRVDTREEAIEKVRSGEALGALVLPEDATERLRATLGLGGGEPPTVEVYYNAEDPVKRRFVEATIESRLAEANAALSEVVLREAAGYIDVIVRGGEIPLPLVGAVQILGLERSRAIIDSVAAGLPEDSPDRAALEQVSRFAAPGGREPRRLAADPGHDRLARAGRADDRRGRAGRRSTRSPSALAVTVSLMFVTLLLAAGLLALEREEQAFGRLVRGLVSRTALLTEKVVLSAALRVRRHAADAVRAGRLRRARLEPRAGLAGRAGGRRARLRGDGRGDRRPGARGARRDAAGDPARAADRLPRARARRAAWRPRSTTRSTSSRRCSRSSRRCARSTARSTAASCWCRSCTCWR